MPEEHGSVRNLTNSSGTAERYPVWSPDGKYIAYFSDKTGEYELYIRQSDGKGETRQITKMGKGYKYGVDWAPNSKLIAFNDNYGCLYYLDI